MSAALQRRLDWLVDNFVPAAEGPRVVVALLRKDLVAMNGCYFTVTEGVLGPAPEEYRTSKHDAWNPKEGSQELFAAAINRRLREIIRERLEEERIDRRLEELKL